MTPALARIKRGVREAVGRCGGVDGAGATANRCRSVAGAWNNLNDPAFPPVDCAFALDEVAVAQGFRPPILSAQALELGCVLVHLPSPSTDGDELAGQLVCCVEEVGDVAHALRAAMAPESQGGGKRTRTELIEIDLQTVELLAAAARMRAIVQREIDQQAGRD